jgi:hypothetical protein
MANEEKQHRDRAKEIGFLLGEEYASWHGLRTFSTAIALGEYILDLTEDDHDTWLLEARESFLKWKKDHSIETAYPTNPRA